MLTIKAHIPDTKRSPQILARTRQNAGSTTGSAGRLRLPDGFQDLIAGDLYFHGVSLFEWYGYRVGISELQLVIDTTRIMINSDKLARTFGKAYD